MPQPPSGLRDLSTPTSLHKTMSSSQKHPEEDYSHIDPDELFVRFTISEIKVVHSRLRADADAKQEELRLMVGERYRDLLQASTSILSLTESSRHVLDALGEMRESVISEPQQKPRSSSIRGKDDAHLKVLQSLSAHLKLLLDAPEHLWRLLEKKDYLQAAWLYLLVRVVHRALITEDPEEGSWVSEGINVLAQFPLVQRQWDTIAPFRSQIAHRATQYLRELHITSTNTCSTVLTLHFLDSLPLVETLTTLLSQRSRTLNALLARNLDLRSDSHPGSPLFKGRRRGLDVAGSQSTPPPFVAPDHSRNRRSVMRDVREAVIGLLDVIDETMRIARDVFRSGGDESPQKSLAEQFLEDIQADTPTESTCTTRVLLSTLPSSTHLLTLPPSILSYKPYIDLTSPSARVDPVVLEAKLSAWFGKGMEGFEGRMQVWFAGLESIREIWNLRRKVLARLQLRRGLEQPERHAVLGVLDGCVKRRVCEVAKTALETLEESLDSTMRRIVQDIRNGVNESQFDITPSTFLFSVSSLPQPSQMATSTSSTTSPVKLFKEVLRRRVDGRTPLLHSVLSELERRTQEIDDNLNAMNEDDNESHCLRGQIMTIYHENVHSSSKRLCQILERIIKEELVNEDGGKDEVTNVVTFVGRVCYYMSESPCLHKLRCQTQTVQALRESLDNLHERSLDCWRRRTVSKAIQECNSMFVSSPWTLPNEFVWASQPSSSLINALLSITASLDRLGLSRATLIHKSIINTVTRDFQSAVVAKVSVEDRVWQRDTAQLLWDLTFLNQLTSNQDPAPRNSLEAESALSVKLSELMLHLQSVATPQDTLLNLRAHIDHSVAVYLPRSQTLLAPLLTLVMSTAQKPSIEHMTETATAQSEAKLSALLPVGLPEVDQDYRPAIEIMKTSTRFGLLMVGNTAMR